MYVKVVASQGSDVCGGQKRKIRKTKNKHRVPVAQKKRSGQKSVNAVREEDVKLRGVGFTSSLALYILRCYHAVGC